MNIKVRSFHVTLLFNITKVIRGLYMVEVTNALKISVDDNDGRASKTGLPNGNR